MCVYTPRFLHAESNACSVRYMDFITLLSGVNLLRTHQGTEAVLLSKPGVDINPLSIFLNYAVVAHTIFLRPTTSISIMLLAIIRVLIDTMTVVKA